MKALTPDSLTQTARSLRLPRFAVPTFRPQPRDPPDGRFEYQSPQRHQLFQASPHMSRLATRSRRNRFVILRTAGSHLRLLSTPPHGDAVTFNFRDCDHPRHGLAPCRQSILTGRTHASAGWHPRLRPRIDPLTVDGRNKPGHDGKRTTMGHSQGPLV